MGGFAFNYVEESEDLVRAGYSPSDPLSTPTFDFYRIDDTRVLCLMWATFSAPISAFVIDYSSPTSIAVGAIVDFDARYGPSDFRANATQLTVGGDWLANLGPAGIFQRFSISGTTITVGAVISIDVDFFPGDSRVPAGLFEGHTSAESATLQMVFSADSHMTLLGVDFDHLLVSGGLTWGVGHLEVKWYVIDLTLPAPVAQFDHAATGFYPSQYTPGQDAPGVGYAWVYDTWPPGVAPTGLHLVYVETDGSSISVAEVTGYSFDGNAFFQWPPQDPRLGRANDGSYWFHAVDTVDLGFWSPTNRFPYRTTSLQISGATLTSHDYLGEMDLSEQPRMPDFAWSIDDDYLADNNGRVSWKIDDGHYRAEKGSDQVPYHTDAPHFQLFPAGCGLSHKRMAFVYAYSATFGAPFDIYVAVYVETGLPPSPDFNVDPSTVDAGTPINFDAEDYLSGHDTEDETRDSYWHPVLEYRWEWDDRTADVYSTSPTAAHTYRRGSATHITGADTSDADIDTGLIGETGFYLPLLRARNSVGWSYAQGRWWITVNGPSVPPPQRQFPRDDGLGISTRRSWPPPISKQYGLRRGAAGTYQ